MYDDLRNLSDKSASPFQEESAPKSYQEPAIEKRLFGLTAAQRLVLSIELLATVVVMAIMFLLVTQKIWPY